MEMTLNRYSEENSRSQQVSCQIRRLKKKFRIETSKNWDNLIFEPCHNLSRVSPELVKS